MKHLTSFRVGSGDVARDVSISGGVEVSKRINRPTTVFVPENQIPIASNVLVEFFGIRFMLNKLVKFLWNKKEQRHVENIIRKSSSLNVIPRSFEMIPGNNLPINTRFAFRNDADDKQYIVTSIDGNKIKYVEICSEFNVLNPIEILSCEGGKRARIASVIDSNGNVSTRQLNHVSSSEAALPSSRRFSGGAVDLAAAAITVARRKVSHSGRLMNFERVGSTDNGEPIGMLSYYSRSNSNRTPPFARISVTLDPVIAEFKGYTRENLSVIPTNDIEGTKILPRIRNSKLVRGVQSHIASCNVNELIQAVVVNVGSGFVLTLAVAFMARYLALRIAKDKDETRGLDRVRILRYLTRFRNW